MKTPIRIAVTGAAGNISYSLIFRISAGGLFGQDQPVILHLLEVPQARDRLQGVVMELFDCNFNLLHGIEYGDDPYAIFADVDYAFLVGSKPRGPGMERNELLSANGEIFKNQGDALSSSAAKNVRVLVVGNPANTNALIAIHNAKQLDASQFTAMTRLDQNRAVSQLAAKAGCMNAQIKRVIIWGNHSSTQYPDIEHARIGDQSATDVVDTTWSRNQFISAVQKRGAAIINARGASSAASAAAAAIDHMRDWVLGNRKDDWASMGLYSLGHYQIPEGIIYSYPTICSHGSYEIVRDLPISEFSNGMMANTAAELVSERDAVRHLLT